MTTLFAQPYDLSATGFYFESIEEYETKVRTARNDCGFMVKEFEIQFIDGEQIDCELAKAIEINQANFPEFLTLIDELDEHEKIKFIIAIGECGYTYQPRITTTHATDRISTSPSLLIPTLQRQLPGHLNQYSQQSWERQVILPILKEGHR